MESGSPGAVMIKVDANGNVDKSEVTLYRDKHDVVFWVCEDRTRSLFIEFERNGPFEAMTRSGNRWRVHCNEWMCFSRDIHENALGGGERYKYWQILKDENGSVRAQVDGWIVIRP